MSDVKEISCRLCLKNITDESFELIDNSIRDILDVLFLKLKFDNESKEVICNVCRRKLNMASEFKSTCLNTDNTIMHYADNEKMLQLNLREVYMQEKKNELVDISCTQKICRLCMHLVESEFRCIHEEELEAIEKLTPEMNINIVKDPVVCKPCFYSLCTHNSFLKDCSEVEEKIKSIFDGSATGSQIDTSPLDLFVKTEKLDKEFDINEMEMSIKPEYVDIKSEVEERSGTPLQSSDIVPFEESDCKDEEGYETESKKLLQKHQLRRKDSSQVEKYRCNDCNYETIYKNAFEQHKLQHTVLLQVQMYKCNNCNYETIYEHAIEQHQLQHKDLSQVQMYKCNECNYETKYKNVIEQHQLQHKKPSHVQIYETNYECIMKQHQLKHKDPSEVQIYKCNECNYQTKYKRNMKPHQLKHKTKDGSGIGYLLLKQEESL
ncbi:zinc finger protein 510-like [Anoplophora glabripennis]|uniref:zinc finger protein 510-like n=1 Tax=Anoplophora glabripennis TaxID=217634 RepID=UPI00087438B5|nr:zinc finger protein 510-like [Anoplophora glabripennis]